MREPKQTRLWDIYKQGGLTSAITSVFNTQNAQHMAYIRSVMKEQRKDASLATPIKELQVTVFDLETSGFFPNIDEILSVGAIHANGAVINMESTFYTLVQPKRPVPALITQLTGITDELAADGLILVEALHQFLRFIENRALIAHGSGHDKQFLNVALWQTSRVRLSHRVLDTMMIAKWLRPSLSNYGLDEVLEEFDIEVTTRHHALEDSIMTAKLWSRFVEEMSERQVITLNDLYAHLSK
jgi:DNA polymerase-3 subunit epsilon